MASAETFEDPPRAEPRKVLLAFLLVVLLVLVCRPAVAAPSGFTHCAAENSYCELSGVDVYITFGAGEGSCDFTALTCTGSYSPPVRYAVGYSNPCRADLLGVSTDPAPGVLKSCFWIAAGGTPPPDPDPGADTFDPGNATHLLQAVLVMGHVGMLWAGFRSGDKL